MPLSAEDIKALKLGDVGLPAGFQGDRLDAFRMGINVAVATLQDKVSVDKPKGEKEE